MAHAGVRIIGQSLSNVPWEPRPTGCTDVVWRCGRNPIVPRDHLPESNSIFNSSVAPVGDGFVGVFRVDDRRYRHRLHVGRSDDGVRWRIDPEPITLTASDPDTQPSPGGYDPRLTAIDGRYYVTWCNGYHGPTVGIAWTDDFESFHLMENALVPHNRNGVLFPRKVGGHYLLLNRPSAPGHFAHGNIFLSRSPDLRFWGLHRHVMAPARGWDDTKIGAGPAPLETSEGWLVLYHRMGGAILDLEEPWRLRYRSAPYLLGPRETYELTGDVPNVIFPCGLLADAETGRLAIYYGAADTCIGLAFAEIDELVNFIKTHTE